MHSAPQLIEKALTLQALSFVWIPLGVLAITHFVQARFNMRLSTGIDLFAFMLALDMGLIANSSAASRINPTVRPYYIQVFMLAWIASIIMLANSARIQAKITAGSRKLKYYPVEQVFICWFFAFVMISFHLYAILGG